ncbi:MAG: hypothetical protein HYR80_05195 [Nitrospirae bacterium]|nr:hypothetical protein [Nitrospirota bacterium]
MLIETPQAAYLRQNCTYESCIESMDQSCGILEEREYPVAVRDLTFSVLGGTY